MFVKTIINILLRILERQHETEIPQWFPKSDSSPPLNIGVILAIFISSEKTLDCE